MRIVLFLVFFLGAFFSTSVIAANISGTWKFEKAREYSSEKKVPAPKYATIQILNGELGLSPNCFVKLSEEPYFYSTVFQSLLREGVEKETLNQYVKNNFSFDLANTKIFYKAERVPSKCNEPFTRILFSENRLLVTYANSLFFSYVRSGTGRIMGAEERPYDYVTSQLPFDGANFMNLCESLIPRAKGVPQATEKCAPLYYPYVAMKGKADALVQLIGSHDYKKGGASYADDYATPFSHNLHPVFLVFPPMKDVVLVRVEDMEPGENENRDVMSGVYLAIKNSKVTDQLNESCSIDEEYFCINQDGKKLYQLLETGKFKTLK